MSKIIPSNRRSGQLQNIHYYPEEHKSTFQKIISDKIFWVTVLIPTIIAIIYYTFIASGIYISESKFIVRAQSKDSQSALPATLSGVLGSIGGSLGGLTTSQNDSLTAENYISSRDALAILNREFDLKSIFSGDNIDLIHRYGGLKFWDKSQESFFNYYIDNIINITHDADSGITKLTVRAFSPEIAYKINVKLNDLSEELINRLNERARQDMLSFSEKEVEIAKKRVEQVNQKIYQFRNTSTTASPNQQITAFQQMVSEKEFADRNLSTSIAALEQARIDTLKKRLYLERISNANQPDIAMEPHRIRGIFNVLSLGMLLWGILSMMIAGIKEHHD